MKDQFYLIPNNPTQRDVVELLQEATKNEYDLGEEIKRLKEMVEKMKCCGNCKHEGWSYDEPAYCELPYNREDSSANCKYRGGCDYNSFKADLWELDE